MASEFALLSNHGVALVCIARDPGMRLRDIADKVGVTERTAHSIVSDLVDAGYVRRQREGVRNHYEIQPEVPLQHPELAEHWVGELLVVLSPNGELSGDGRGGDGSEQGGG
jgi:winged helix-turn-helix DNA-binding protein